MPRHTGALGRDAGLSTIEVVLLAPLIMTLVLFIAALGLLVDAQGTVNGAARDAARAGSLERSAGMAMTRAREVADADIGAKCRGGLTVEHLESPFVEGGLFTVRVSCVVPLAAFDLLGLEPTKTVTAQSTAPLDKYKRVEP